MNDYPFSEDLLKELLQNADDSGATVLHFIKDPRNLPVEKIFEDSWKPLQGPALCVYNNKSFTRQDLIGIKSLGEGSKSDDLTKTGQYGVGFNCVYHLTDVPLFLTTVESSGIIPSVSVESDDDEIPIEGTVLVLFDPNCKFNPAETTRENPGAMYDKMEELRDTFSDVFSGFLQCEETYNLSRNGTFFRFPLRNEEAVAVSEISKTTNRH